MEKLPSGNYALRQPVHRCGVCVHFYNVSTPHMTNAAKVGSCAIGKPELRMTENSLCWKFQQKPVA